MISLLVLIWISIVILISHLTCDKSKIEAVAFLVAQWVSIWAVLYEAGSIGQQGKLKKAFRVSAFVVFISYMLIISYLTLSRHFGFKSLEDLF